MVNSNYYSTVKKIKNEIKEIEFNLLMEFTSINRKIN